MENLFDDVEMVEDFVTEATERLDRVADLALAAEEGSQDAWAALRREIHTLKGAAGFLGYDEFSELCHDLEEYLLAATKHKELSDDFDVVHESCDVLRELTERVEACLETRAPLKKDPRVGKLRNRLRLAS